MAILTPSCFGKRRGSTETPGLFSQTTGWREEPLAVGVELPYFFYFLVIYFYFFYFFIKSDLQIRKSN